MVDRICQGEDDAALDRKQQAAEVLGDRWDGMGMGDDEGMHVRGQLGTYDVFFEKKWIG